MGYERKWIDDESDPKFTPAGIIFLATIAVALFFGLPEGARAQSVITKIENPPPSIDMDVVNRLWTYVKKEAGAPDNLTPPLVTLDWDVPMIARMGTQIPTEWTPNLPLQISIAPRTIDMTQKEMVLFGIGHEMTHYVFVLKENNWDASKKTFSIKRKHHCDKEFKKITYGVADQLWNMYHSDTLKYQMYQEVMKSCANFPDQ